LGERIRRKHFFFGKEKRRGREGRGERGWFFLEEEKNRNEDG